MRNRITKVFVLGATTFALAIATISIPFNVEAKECKEAEAYGWQKRVLKTVVEGALVAKRLYWARVLAADEEAKFILTQTVKSVVLNGARRGTVGQRQACLDLIVADR